MWFVAFVEEAWQKLFQSVFCDRMAESVGVFEVCKCQFDLSECGVGSFLACFLGIRRKTALGSLADSLLLVLSPRTTPASPSVISCALPLAFPEQVLPSGALMQPRSIFAAKRSRPRGPVFPPRAVPACLFCVDALLVVKLLLPCGDRCSNLRPVSYTHLPSPRDRQKSRMPSSA